MSRVIGYLEGLSRGLSELGMETRLVSEEPPILHVRNPGPPALQEVIGCRVVPGGGTWFYWAALDVLLSPVHEISSACDRVALVLSVLGGERCGSEAGEADGRERG